MAFPTLRQEEAFSEYDCAYSTNCDNYDEWIAIYHALEHIQKQLSADDCMVAVVDDCIAGCWRYLDKLHLEFLEAREVNEVYGSIYLLPSAPQ